MALKEDDLNGRWPQTHKILLADNLGSWFSVCHLVLNEVEDKWSKKEDEPKGWWPKLRMTSN
jgi:hypothetical protein